MPSRGSRRRGRGTAPEPEEQTIGPNVSRTLDDVCALCGRSIPSHARASRHHLVPKLKGGGRLPTVRLHQVCHSAIHARFSEAELARRLSDPETLRADPELARFIAWVATKPDDFHVRTRMTTERRAARPRR